MTLAVNRCYIQPITAGGVAQDPDADLTFANGRGVYTLTAATTYFFILPIGGSVVADIHLTHDLAIAVTSATVETCSHGKSEVADNSVVAGEWMDQDPADAYVSTVGAGTTQTIGVVAVVAGNAGGANWQIDGFAAARGRLKVVVGATGGEVRLSFCGKD